MIERVVFTRKKYGSRDISLASFGKLSPLLDKEKMVLQKYAGLFYAGMSVTWQDIDMEAVLRKASTYGAKVITLDSDTSIISGVPLLNIARVATNFTLSGVAQAPRPLMPNTTLWDNRELATLTDVGSFSGDTINYVLRNYDNISDVVLGLACNLATIEQGNDALRFLEVEDWVEEGDFLYLGRWLRTQKGDYILPYLLYPKAMSVEPLNIQYLLKDKELLSARRAFSDNAGKWQFPYSIDGNSVLDKVLVLDFDETILGKEDTTALLLREVKRLIEPYGARDSYTALQRGLFATREDYFNSVWRQAIYSIPALLEQRVESTLKETRAILSLLGNLRDLGYIPIMVSDAPAIYLKECARFLKRYGVDVFDPFYLIISGEVVGTKRAPEISIIDLLSFLYYDGIPEGLSVMMVDDNESNSGFLSSPNSLGEVEFVKVGEPKDTRIILEGMLRRCENGTTL